MKKGNRLIVLMFAALAFGAVADERPLRPASADAVAMADRPNIIFMLADDLRADAVGYAGNEVVQTPNIDKLAKGGVVFESAFVTTPISPTIPPAPVLGEVTWDLNTRPAITTKKPDTSASVGMSTCQDIFIPGIPLSNNIIDPNSSDMIPATLNRP